MRADTPRLVMDSGIKHLSQRSCEAADIAEIVCEANPQRSPTGPNGRHKDAAGEAACPSCIARAIPVGSSGAVGKPMLEARKTGRVRQALAAALLLVVQAFVAAFALGAGASAAPLDAFGNPICATSADYGHHPGTHSGHANLPECCVAGCPMAAAGPGTPTDAVGFVTRLGAERGDVSWPALPSRPVSVRSGLSGSPRAPPSAC